MDVKKIAKKIKKKGLKGCFESLEWHTANFINKRFFYYYQKRQIIDKLIVFESGGEITDNAYALYDYMGRNGYLEKYHVVWLVYEIARPRKEHKIQTLYPNTKIIWGKTSGVHREWDKCLALCKWHIYDHTNWLEQYRKRDDQVIINLWHGCGFKAPKGGSQKKPLSPAQVNIITGLLYAQVSTLVFNCKPKNLLDVGYPRNDYLFQNFGERQNNFLKHLRLDKYIKVFLWMPTFRSSSVISLDEQYFNSRTGLPIIETESQLDQFNNFLKSINSVCIFKVHHLQASLRPFQKSFSNIILLHDEDIQKYGLQLYQIVPMADCLITDYSSIANDFMLLDRPIIYTVDDYEEYKNSRGFIPEDPIKYFAGECVKDYADFTKAIKHVAGGQDLYKEERKEVLPQMHTHADGNSSKRIVEFLGL